MPWRENKGVANLNGIYTDILGLRERKMFWSSESRGKARFHYAES